MLMIYDSGVTALLAAEQQRYYANSRLLTGNVEAAVIPQPGRPEPGALAQSPPADGNRSLVKPHPGANRCYRVVS